MKTALKSALLSLLVCGICNAIQVSGDVYGTWTAENNPYEVISDLHVPQCSTLVIEAGCYIDFQGYYKLEVDTNAVFRALGAESDSIVFTTSDTLTGWNGIRFYSTDSISELRHCVIEYGGVRDYSQTPYNDGGGIYSYNSTILIANSNIRYNKALEKYGGGVCCYFSNISISNSIIYWNEASRGGSGVFCYTSTVVIDNCLFEYNKTFSLLGGEYGGGSIGCLQSDVIICNNIIQNNFCGRNGGGILVELSPSVIITNNIISNNKVLESGGGLFLTANDSVYIHSNVILYNRAGFNGGGITCSNSPAIIENNTIAFDSSGWYGSGVFLGRENDVQLTNNILWDNWCYSDDSLQIYSLDSGFVVNYSCVQYGWPGEGNIDTNPMFVEPSHWDFHLRWDNYPSDDDTKSPCIDAGAPWSPLDPDSTRADMGALPFDQLVGIDDDFNDRLPRHIMLYQNYPNPFNASTLIRYELPTQSQVTIDIYDILGRKVQTLQDGLQPAGEYQINWLAENLSSGVYFYKIQAGDYNESRRMTLVK